MINRDVLFITIAIGLYWGMKWHIGKRDGSAADMPNKIFAWIAVVGALGLMIGTQYFGNKIPGSFFERRTNYKGMFYVNLFPDGQKVKSYRVPAMVAASYEVVGDEMDGDHEVHDVYDRVYKIQFAIMPNSGKVSFNDPYEALKLGEIVTMVDDDKRYWGIELTNCPVRQSSPVVK